MSKKWFVLASMGAAVLLASALAGTAAGKPAQKQRTTAKITLGFSQVGSESGWRTANTKSIQFVGEGGRVTLKFSDAQQKQENQIQAIRSYIQQHVDVIAFSPVVASGWDAVLNEAKRAKIPVILTDRAVDSKDPTLYKTFLGSDFIREGRYAGKWVADQYKGATGPVRIVELQGTTGSSPAIDRAKGFRQMIKGNKNLKIVASQTGEFTRAKGKEVMAAFLKANPKIDLLFAHNDDMGLGAIEAIEEAGLKPGKDIMARVLFDERIATLAVVIYVLLPLPGEVGHDTLSDSLALLGFVSALRLGEMALHSRGWHASVACGLVAGLGFLARPEVLVAPAAVFLVAAVQWWRPSLAGLFPRRRRDPSPALRAPSPGGRGE